MGLIFTTTSFIEACTMAPHSPKPSSAGVLPISPLAAQRGSSNKPSPKPAAPQLKVLIRRLPPGLTAQEFVAVLGDEWKVGNGKVDWFRFKEGKVFKECVFLYFLPLSKGNGME